MEDYIEENERTINMKIKNITDGMPKICRDFFMSLKTTLSPRTRLGYAYDIRLFLKYMETVKTEKITEEDIKGTTAYTIDNYMDYITKYTRDEKTALTVKNGERGKARKLSALNKFFGFLVKRGIIDKSPTEVIDMPKIHEKEIILLDGNETGELLDCIATGGKLSDTEKKYYKHTRLRDIAIITLMLGTGMRVSECVGIDTEDINFNDKSVKVMRKGGNEARIFFGDEVKKALMDYKAERDNMKPHNESRNAFFLSLKNNRITARAVQLIVKKYSERVTNKKISPHKLRSTFATRMYGQTHDIYLVAECLGHRSVDTTRKHYAKLDDERRRHAADKFVINNL